MAVDRAAQSRETLRDQKNNRWKMWKKNSVAFWDNRSTQHYAVMDYPPCHRKMERAGIVGDLPY